MRFLRVIVFLLCTFFIQASFSIAAEKPFERSCIVMGTIGKAQIWGLDEARAEALCQKVFQEWKEVDQTMSLYKPTSDLMRLNEHAGQNPITVSDDLIEILQQAKDYAMRTQGIFDVRIGELMDLWGLGVAPRKRAPAPGELASARMRSRRAEIYLNPATHQAAIRDALLKIDLGGIAKGYALDKTCQLLLKSKAQAALLDLGGQLMVYHPPAEGWLIGVRKPGNPEEIVGTLKIQSTCSISTSSQEDRFRMLGRIRLGHVIDPRTGHPVRARGSGVVVASTATQADVLSTVLLVRGMDRMGALLKDFPGVELLRIVPDKKNRWRYWQSSGIQKIFRPQKTAVAF